MATEQLARPGAARGGCPVHHGVGAWQSSPETTIGTPAVERDGDGTWHIRSHALVRQILRNAATTQAGFGADMINSVPGTVNQPILYQEGKVHQEQRKQTARFFTPKVVSGRYRDLMIRLVDDLIARFRRAGRADLTAISMQLAVAVAAEVVGLTDSTTPGLDRRLDAFFDHRDEARTGLLGKLTMLRNRGRMLAFFFLDVRPAIRARRRTPQEDVISHLIARDYNDTEILTECVTYGAAGMATTREFIAVAAWHFLADPALREGYLAAPERERHALLEEILRLEPVVGHLYRRTTEAVSVAHDGVTTTIPVGARLDLHIHGANRDEAVTGPRPEAICPGRSLLDKQTSPAVLSFGDGHHRCPGQFIAIQETDIFLRRLLALPGLRLEREPTVTWDELTAGYVLRDCIISDDARTGRTA